MLNGICSVYDSLFPGSAASYLEESCEDADQYYVYKMARTKLDEHTAVIEYSTGNEKGSGMFWKKLFRRGIQGRDYQ